MLTYLLIVLRKVGYHISFPCNMNSLRAYTNENTEIIFNTPNMYLSFPVRLYSSLLLRAALR